MKSTLLAAAVLIAATLLAWTSPQDAGSVHWRQLLEKDVAAMTAERGPLDGAHGAHAIAFRVGPRSAGSAIITGLDRPALGVFVGLSYPPERVNEPWDTLRVEFVLHDGTSRTVAPSAGGGSALLFSSPDDLPMARIAKVGLYVDETAAWTK